MDENEYNIEEISQTEGSFQLEFSGNLNINNASKIHSYLESKCIEPNELVLSFDNIESIDLSIIQLITALLLKRKSTEKQTVTKFNTDSPNSELLLKSGMMDLIERLQKK